MDSDLKQLEAELQKLSPNGISDDLVSRLDEAMSRWHESVPVEEKIVPLSEPVIEQKEPWFQWRAAAVVALFGGASAIFLSQERAVEAPPEINQTGVSQATFTPREAKAQIVGVQDQGYITSPSGQTLRAVGVKVSNEVHFRNDNGDSAKLEKPTYKVIFYPVESD